MNIKKLIIIFFIPFLFSSCETIKEKSKCPFTGAGTPSKYPTGRGTSNRDWWPNSLNLKILSLL